MAGRKRDPDTSSTGRAGQLAVMAQVLLRLRNVAVPEVDVGTDVFVFRDDSDEVAHIQVKTAKAARYSDGSGYSAQFAIPIKQLERPDDPPLFYVLVSRTEDGGEQTFLDYLIIPRAKLAGYWAGPGQFGTETPAGELLLRIQFRGTVVCGRIELTAHRGDWGILPPLRPVVQGHPTAAAGPGV